MSRFRVVADTNVIVSAHRSKVGSPTDEFVKRWEEGEFRLLYSLDVLSEYILKLLTLGARREEIAGFLTDVRETGLFIPIEHYHERTYPIDPDDVAFLLCATNGNATHLVSYDRHLLDLNHRYEFEICRPIPFLNELRASQER